MKEIKTDKSPKAIGPYSQAIDAGDFVFVSGQIAIDPKTNTFDENKDIESQTREVLENIKNILLESGLGLENVVKTEIFITDIQDFKSVNEIYSNYFNNTPMPARQTVEISNLPLKAKIEISCIAKK